MLSLSTAFISTGNLDGRFLLESLEKYNIQGIELDCRLNRDQFEQISAYIGSSRYRMFNQGQKDSQTFRDLLETDSKMREQFKSPHLDALLFNCMMLWV